jgi:hypothetical protein
MGNLAALRHLELVDLMLEPHEAQHLLDEVCSLCCLTLHTLILINTTKIQYQLLHAGVFLNLQVTEKEKLLLNYSMALKKHEVCTQNIIGCWLAVLP